MFPFKEGNFAVQNAWYVAAWSDEISRQPIERWIMDSPVAVYRKEDGSPVALAGRCPHHFFPLGKSNSVGDNIRCGYHGLEFQPDGRAVSAPFLDKIPSACRIRSYPVAERWEWIWIWTGDPALADESLIPDHFQIGLTDPSYDTARGLLQEINARYQLLNDNLLDLQHLEVLHGDNFGVEGMGRATERRESGDGWVSSYRTIERVKAPDFFKPLMEDGERLVDRVTGLRFDIPSLHYGYDAFFIPQGEPDAGKEVGRMNVVHAITPARRNTCHYFITSAAKFARRIPNFGEGMRQTLPIPLKQDVEAAEAIEAMIVACKDAPEEMLFKSDATLVTGRRMMEQMMERERAVRTDPPSLANVG